MHSSFMFSRGSRSFAIAQLNVSSYRFWQCGSSRRTTMGRAIAKLKMRDLEGEPFRAATNVKKALAQSGLAPILDTAPSLRCDSGFIARTPSVPIGVFPE